MLFHAKENKYWPSRNDVEPSLFLSKLLTSAEANYWPTKLDIAGFVWVLKKQGHMLDSSEHPIRVQTDHSAILDIIK